MGVVDFIGAGIGSTVGGPGVGTAIGSAGASAVRSALGHLVGSVVGIFDPGKARDAQRENRAEMWYQIAKQGSTYAGRHVYGGRTLVYTVKEKGYYNDRWTNLKAENPRIAQAAEQLGGLGIPDNPTDGELNQMAQEIDAYNNQSLISPRAQDLINMSTPAPTITFRDGSPLPGTAPVAQISPAAAANVQKLPTMITTAMAPVSHTWMYVLVGVVVLVLLFIAGKEMK